MVHSLLQKEKGKGRSHLNKMDLRGFIMPSIIFITDQLECLTEDINTHCPSKFNDMLEVL